MTLLFTLLLSAAPLPKLSDFPGPLGRLDGVLERPATGAPSGEKIVDARFGGCAKPVPINASRFVAGALFAFQQLIEWMQKQPGLADALFPKGALEELWRRVPDAAPSGSKACSALPKDVVTAPRLCSGEGADQVWFSSGGAPIALVRWSSAGGRDKCLPRISAVLFDAQGRARLRYDADFAAASSAALLGDGQQVVFTWDAKNEVFHPAAKKL